MIRALLLLALGVSLAVNAAQLLRWRETRAATTAAPAARAPLASPAAAQKPDGVDSETWAELNRAGDSADFVAKLRAQGYPPTIIRGLVQLHVRERYTDRYKQLHDAIANAPYWRLPPWRNDLPVERQRRALEREVTEVVQQLLGPHFDALTDRERSNLRRRFGDLPGGKLEALQRIAADYGDMMNEVRAEVRNSILLAEDREKLAMLEKEMRADIARLLTPEELAAYDLRTSRTASQLRYELAAFEPSEREYLALYQINKNFDDRWGSIELLTSDQRRERIEARKSLAGEIEAALGPERYADYKRTTDPSWQNALRFVKELGLEPATTGQLASVHKDISERATAVRGKGLPPDELGTELKKLSDEAHARLLPVLGERMLGTYKQNWGYWLSELRPPSRPPPKT